MLWSRCRPESRYNCVKAIYFFLDFHFNNSRYFKELMQKPIVLLAGSGFTCALLLVPHFRDHFVILKIAHCLEIIAITFACKPPLAVWYVSFHRRNKMEDVWNMYGTWLIDMDLDLWLTWFHMYCFKLVRESATIHDSSWFWFLTLMLEAEPRQRQIALLQRCLVASSCNSGIELLSVERI